MIIIVPISSTYLIMGPFSTTTTSSPTMRVVRKTLAKSWVLWFVQYVKSLSPSSSLYSRSSQEDNLMVIMRMRVESRSTSVPPMMVEEDDPAMVERKEKWKKEMDYVIGGYRSKKEG
ncbi:hypothetical protein Ccrd_000881 [Cynara cardunculus var. scolymus]|uniref:Uncharacterized protein n=1 Tax=Cynara cardunculus var. scolymus TaxID=59895 RepID=A0A103XU99_CYNCS|nr:hypothetical protein Ccrd_000881 [Cynara cardunculus var. scolymus]